MNFIVVASSASWECFNMGFFGPTMSVQLKHPFDQDPCWPRQGFRCVR